MIGKLAIFNMALGFIGTRMLASESENTPEAVQCNLYWDRARRGALRDFPYPFCQKRIQPGEVELPEEYKGIWDHCFLVPPHVLKVNKVGDYAPFELAQGPQGLCIYCNEAAPVAICSVDVPDPAKWDELFITAMAYRLAMFIAVPLLKNNSAKIQELANLYQASLPRLEGHAASETRRPKTETEDWLAARWSWN